MLRMTLPMLAVAMIATAMDAQEPPTAPPPTPRAPVRAPPPGVAEAAERVRLEAERLRSRVWPDFELARELEESVLLHELAPRMQELEWQLQHELAPQFEHDFEWQLQHELAPRLQDLEFRLHEEALTFERDWALHDFDLQRFDTQWERAFEMEQMTQHLETARVEAQQLQQESMREALAPWRTPYSIDLPESRFPQDPADSLYRIAREMLNRGEYRRAAQTFRQIGERFATSRYAPDALYYEAFALYRIGTVADMRAALTLLDQQRERFPRSETDREASSLAMRIRGELAANGDRQAASDIRGIAGQGRAPSAPTPGVPPTGVRAPSQSPRPTQAGAQQATCDRDSLAVKLEALSALSRIESPEVTPALHRVLQRRDECSASLRRRAVLLLGQQAGAQTGDVLIEVARNDPDDDVKREAINMLARVPSDQAVAALQQIVQTGDAQLSASAMRALNANTNPIARQAVRTVLERNDIAESVRLRALQSFSRASPEEAAYLRGVYPKLESRRLRSQAISTISRLDGPENHQWLVALARNEGEAMELRTEAVSRLATTAPIADVARLYDQAGDRRLKERIIVRLAARDEDAAVDKLIAIARSDPDHELRREAIARLSRKKDPRTTQLLLEIIGR